MTETMNLWSRGIPLDLKLFLRESKANSKCSLKTIGQVCLVFSVI